MARRLFTVGKGLRMVKENANEGGANSVDTLFGAGVPPGTTGETDEATVGSTYSNTTTGGLFKKVTDTSSAADWIEFGSADEVRKQLTGVVAAPQILDSVLVDDILASEWEIHMRDDAAPENVESVKLFAMHDGEPSADALLVDDAVYAKLKLNAGFSTILLVEINGAGAAQVMRLSVEGQIGGVTFTSRRNDIRNP